jgi:NADH:ubiquinone oxidoreductase subunit D
MAGGGGILDDPEVRARWEGFQWTPENARKAMDFMMKGHMLADTTAVLSAIDVVFGEVDR